MHGHLELHAPGGLARASWFGSSKLTLALTHQSEPQLSGSGKALYVTGKLLSDAEWEEEAAGVRAKLTLSDPADALRRRRSVRSTLRAIGGAASVQLREWQQAVAGQVRRLCDAHARVPIS
jgi:hypothetical protein